jgi:hypothetical protein
MNYLRSKTKNVTNEKLLTCLRAGIEIYGHALMPVPYKKIAQEIFLYRVFHFQRVV